MIQPFEYFLYAVLFAVFVFLLSYTFQQITGKK